MEGPSSLRPATPDDLPLLAEIEKKVHVAPWNEDHFRAELDKPYSHTLVLTDDETDSVIMAYLVFWLMGEECQILNVAVDTPYRGMGFGFKLVRAAIQAATYKGAEKATLEVRKSNAAAIQLYQKAGFSITQLRKHFYTDGEDAYQMHLPLKEDGLRF